MRLPSLLLILGIALGCQAAEKKPPAGRAANSALELRADLYMDRDELSRQMGAKMEPGIAGIRVHVTPQQHSPITLHRDDFLLRSDKDGQRSGPFAPSQIAGSSVLVISSRGGGAGIMTESGGPVWGGVGGPPRRLGTDNVSVGGAGEAGTPQATAGSDQKGENPLLAALREKELTSGETSSPRTGWLYFPLEGKHKAKDLELIYKGTAGTLSIRFK